jgi:tetratricopeptide (TPR) repeat protein
LSDRLAAARDYVAKKPTDRFGLYALARELRKARAFDESFAAFETLLVHHPDYGAAFFHYGMTKKEAGDRPGAIAILKKGLDACKRSNDGKTRAEIEGAIDELEDL